MIGKNLHPRKCPRCHKQIRVGAKVAQVNKSSWFVCMDCYNQQISNRVVRFL